MDTICGGFHVDTVDVKTSWHSPDPLAARPVAHAKLCILVCCKDIFVPTVSVIKPVLVLFPNNSGAGSPHGAEGRCPL